MSEEFHLEISFRTDNDAVIDFIRSLEGAFEQFDKDRLASVLSNSNGVFDRELEKSLVPKAYKQSLAIALSETAEEIEPVIFAPIDEIDHKLSTLNRGKNGVCIVGASGSDYDGDKFCKYLVILIYCLHVQGLTAKAGAYGWEMNSRIKDGKLIIRRKELDE